MTNGTKLNRALLAFALAGAFLLGSASPASAATQAVNGQFRASVYTGAFYTSSNQQAVQVKVDITNCTPGYNTIKATLINSTILTDPIRLGTFQVACGYGRFFTFTAANPGRYNIEFHRSGGTADNYLKSVVGTIYY